jgi:transposase
MKGATPKRPRQLICQINEKLTPSDQEWISASAGAIDDRDLKAARNIRQRNLANNNKEQNTEGHSGRACGAAAVAPGKKPGS